MSTLTAIQIHAMIEDLETVGIWLRDLGELTPTAHIISDPAREKVSVIKYKLLRAGLGDVAVTGRTTERSAA